MTDGVISVVGARKGYHLFMLFMRIKASVKKLTYNNIGSREQGCHANDLLEIHLISELLGFQIMIKNTKCFKPGNWRLIQNKNAKDLHLSTCRYDVRMYLFICCNWDMSVFFLLWLGQITMTTTVCNYGVSQEYYSSTLLENHAKARLLLTCSFSFIIFSTFRHEVPSISLYIILSNNMTLEICLAKSVYLQNSLYNNIVHAITDSIHLPYITKYFKVFTSFETFNKLQGDLLAPIWPL